MPEGKGRQGESWSVAVKPAGTLQAAEAAAGRVRRLVVEWVQKRRQTGEGQSQCP